MPDGVLNLAQTRHTRPVRHGKTGSSSAHCHATENAGPPFPGDHTHDKLVYKKLASDLSPGDPAARHLPECD